jgi:hypothetical protein
MPAVLDREDILPLDIQRVCLKIFDWPKMAPFRPGCVTKMLIMRCITPLLVPCLNENVLIFGCNPKFKHPLRVLAKIGKKSGFLQTIPYENYVLLRKMGNLMSKPAQKMILRSLQGLCLAFVLLACQRDSGIRVFDLIFPNIIFDIPAGLSGGLPRVYTLDNIATNIKAQLQSTGTDTTIITEIRPGTATMTALQNNVDWSFLQEVTIRICRDGSKECSSTQEAFYYQIIDNRRVLDRLLLTPSLPNARKTMIRDRFKLEVIFQVRPGMVSPTAIRTRLDLSFQAFRPE